MSDKHEAKMFNYLPGEGEAGRLRHLFYYAHHFLKPELLEQNQESIRVIFDRIRHLHLSGNGYKPGAI